MTERQTDTVASLAALALSDAAGDVVRGTNLMAERIMDNRRLYRALMDPLVRTACYDVIRSQCRASRRVIWNQQQPSAASTRERVGDLSVGILPTLMDFPLLGGGRLGDGLRGDVIATSEFYLTQSQDMAAKGRWLRLIAQHIPESQRVRDALTVDRLIELQEAAAHD